MANRVVKDALKHCYDTPTSAYPIPIEPQEPDKNRSISELSRIELNVMMSRLRDEVDLQRLIKELKRNSGEKDSYDNPFKVDTKTPINQLYHHGILGMKWGVRRYQNKDGTRTAAGKRRERSGTTSEKTDASKSKGLSDLSNEDLKKINERLQLEETYRRLTANQIGKSESWVKKAVTNASEQALADFTKGVFLGSAKLLVKELSPEFAEVAFKIKDKDKDKKD